MYAPQGVQSTGTNRPRTCPTHPQVITATSKDTALTLLASTVHIPTTTPTPHPGVGHVARVGVVRCSGGHSGGETPGPIPNPEAKPSSADGTATDRSWESRTPPEHPTTPTHTQAPGNTTRGLSCVRDQVGKRRHSPGRRSRMARRA